MLMYVCVAYLYLVLHAAVGMRQAERERRGTHLWLTATACCLTHEPFMSGTVVMRRSAQRSSAQRCPPLPRLNGCSTLSATELTAA
jgi:hypothetical protein